MTPQTGRDAQSFEPARVTRVTRAKLMVVLPLTMALLVAATGFFTMSMTERAYVLHGTASPLVVQNLLSVLGLQIAAISFIAAILGLGMAIGVTAPLREIAQRLGAMASGDLRGGVEMGSTSEVDSLAGAVNEALRAINRYVFQSMTGAVITLNAEGIVIGSSPAAEATFGYHEDEIVGKRFSEVFVPATGGHATLAAIEAAIAKRQPVAVDDVMILSKDGEAIRIGISASYLRRGDRRQRTTDRTPGAIDQDEAVGVTIAFKDLTEIRRLRDRLHQADQLVTLGTVTAGVAHELRNPLGSLRGLVELLGRDFPEGDRRQQYVTTMLTSIDRLNRLVEDLLLFSSPAAPIVEEVDVTSLVRETVMFVRMGLGTRQVTLDAIEEPGARFKMSGNRERLGQALSNIVLNAVQASPDGSTVTVRTMMTPFPAIRVHNTGSYIAPERREQLFVPFYSTKPMGTGLGLAISRQIVTAQGGRIEVESDPSAGTTFVIALPAGHEPPTDQSSPLTNVPMPTPHWPLATG